MPWLICGTYPSVDTVDGEATLTNAAGMSGTAFSAGDNSEILFGQAFVKLSSGLALRNDHDKNQWPGIPDDSLIIQSPDKAKIWHLPIGRGTPALAAASSITAAEFGGEMPYVLLAADNGKGNGSRKVYEYLCQNAAKFSGWGITFHYLLPDVDWHNKVLIALQELPERPTLCADAGFMYVAKMSGYADEYELFTPDIGELSFLADENAPHPFYTRGFLLASEDDAPELIQRAYANENAAKNMLVKGKTDLVVQQGTVLDKIDYPMIPNLEPIGGTGDTVAGAVSALLAGGMPTIRACSLAARANRFMGQLAQPSPATQISELLAQLPGGLRLAVQELS